MDPPRKGETLRYCDHCRCTRTMKVLVDSSTLCYICGTEKGPRVKVDPDAAWRRQGEAEAQWQTDWGSE